MSPSEGFIPAVHDMEILIQKQISFDCSSKYKFRDGLSVVDKVSIWDQTKTDYAAIIV